MVFDVNKLNKSMDSQIAMEQDFKNLQEIVKNKIDIASFESS